MKIQAWPDAFRHFRENQLWLVKGALLVCSAWFVFSPSIHGDWLWDDFEIRDNLTLHNAPGLAKIWFSPASADYYPLESTALWVEWHLWHESLLGYHLVTVALHVLSGILVWRLLEKLGLRSGWVAGLLFVVHPLAVESVAWIAELKNTLSLPALLLAMDALVDFERAGIGKKRGPWLRCFGWFLTAMLCKSSVVMFPLVALTYLGWRRGRIGWPELRAVLPLLGVSLGLGLVTLHFQIRRAVGDWILPNPSFAQRVVDAGRAIAFYAGKVVWPRELMPIYPPWKRDESLASAIAPWAVLALAGVLLYFMRRPWRGAVAFGFGWFLLNLVPILGFAPMSFQHIAPVADHFAYISILGALGLGTAAFEKANSWIDRGKAALPIPGSVAHACLAAIVVLAVGLLAVAARRYSRVFVDQETQWSYNLRHNSRSPMVYMNLAFAVNEKGRLDEAISYYEKAIQLDPEDARTEKDVGEFLVGNKRLAAAIPHFERALSLDPNQLSTRRGLAKTLLEAGRSQDAIPVFESCLKEKADDAEMETDLGKALDKIGMHSEAKTHLEKALKIDSKNPEPENSLGLDLVNEGKIKEGMTHLRRAIEFEPDFPEANNNLGLALVRDGHPQDAIASFEKAIKLKPDFAQAYNNLGFALASTGKRREAIIQIKHALELEPNDVMARFNLATLLESEGQLREAYDQLEAALKLKPDFDSARSALYRLKGILLIEPRP